MLRYLLAAVTLVGAFSFAAHKDAAANPQSVFPPSLQGKPIVVRVHADWCLECKATQPVYERLEKRFGSSVHFVAFDVTDAKTSAASAAMADSLRLRPLFEHDKTAPSTVSIVDPRTGKVVARFWDDTNYSDYADAIKTVLARLRER